MDAAIDKISDYYMKSAGSDAHIMAMRERAHVRFTSTPTYLSILVLDPTPKAAHIRRYWGNDLLHEALENAEAMVHLSISHL